MLSRNGNGDPRTLMTIGMSALLIASLGRWFIHPATTLGTDVADAIYGLLIGIAIATILLSVRRSRGKA